MVLRETPPYPEHLRRVAEDIAASSEVPLPGNPYSICFDDDTERIAVWEGSYDVPSTDLREWLGGLAAACEIETNDDEILQLSWAIEDEYNSVVGLRNA